jgi:hypothetical protein
MHQLALLHQVAQMDETFYPLTPQGDDSTRKNPVRPIKVVQTGRITE